MATTTVSGGSNVTFKVGAAEEQAARDAIARISGNYTTSEIYKSPLLPLAPNVPGRMDVYNIHGGGTFNAPVGADAIIVDTRVATKITAKSVLHAGNPDSVLIIGSNAVGTDTISLSVRSERA